MIDQNYQCPCPQCMGTLEPPEPTEEEILAHFESRCNRLVLRPDKWYSARPDIYTPYFSCALDRHHDGPCARYFGDTP